MDIMEINNESGGHLDVVDDEARSRLGNESTESGKFENQMLTEVERAGRKRKPRRFKNRGKGKSCASSSNSGVQKKQCNWRHLDAPNNTNQFLMAEHTIEDLDDALLREKRHRESSFTSCDTEDDQFYSSPEDEDEFLTKDFDTAYQSMCHEKFANLSKPQLTKIIIELEAKVEELTKQVLSNSKLEEMSSMLMQMNAIENKDEVSVEIRDVLSENERLRKENEELKQLVNRQSSSSSSSTSSEDTVSESEAENDVKENEVVRVNGDITQNSDVRVNGDIRENGIDHSP